jgi:hypothetical protein
MEVGRYVGDEAPNGNRFRHAAICQKLSPGWSRRIFSTRRAPWRKQRLTIHRQNDEVAQSRLKPAISEKIGWTDC